MIDRHESSVSMIQFCACAKSSRSSLENLKSSDSSNSCKSCGAKLPVDGPGSQSVSMLRTVGLELPRVIDPHLTWKTASNGRRAVRRARTAFAGSNRKKVPAQSSKESEHPIDHDRKRTGYMPVSESEKLGVSILGRRFSETLDSIPIKKRRFLINQSSSPPHHSSSQSERCNHSVDNKPASYTDTVVNRKNRLPHAKSGYRGRISADIISEVEEIKEKSFDAADFSGISILAAVACDDNITGAAIITEASVSKEYSTGGQIAPNSYNLHFLAEKKAELLHHVSGGLVGRTDLTASSVLPKASNDVNSDGTCNLGTPMKSLPKIPNRATESTSRDVKLRWDLNTVMDDVWESNDDGVSNSEPCSTNVGVEGGRKLSDRTGLQSSDSQLAEKISEVLVDGNICGNVMTAGVTADENMHNCVQMVADISKGRHVTSPDGDKTKAAEMKVDTKAAEMKIDSTHVEMNDDKCHLLTDENLNDTTIKFPDHIESGTVLDNSTVMTLDDANVPPENGALASHGLLRNYKDGYASSPGQFQDHLDSGYSSDASQNDTDQAIRMEKVECLGDDDDDDSQYEDGEFRQPDAGSWFNDGAEEGETECVDYDSDRETDIYEAAFDHANSVNPQVNNVAFLDTSLGIPYSTHVGKDLEHLGLPSILNCPVMEDALDSGAGKKNDGRDLEKGLGAHARTEDGSNIKDAFKSSNTKVIGNNGSLNGGDSARELSRIPTSRMKMSGWDQLPGSSRSSVQNHNGASLDPSVGSESVRRASGSSMRDLSSRMDGAQSSDGFLKKDKLYVRASRSNNHNHLNSQVEGDAGAACSLGKSRSSLQLQVKGRADHWVDYAEHHGNSRHDSSGYSGPASFSNPGSRNAAAAAVAKLESNGFVVAPDGTIVKASAVGSLGRSAQGYAKAPSQSSLRSPMGRGSVIERERPYDIPPGCNYSSEISPDSSLQAVRGRDGRYGPRVVTMRQRDRYRAPISDDIVNSPSSMNHPISRSDQSFSPRRRHFHLSRSRSRSLSRSRTRSPRWSSPRRRNDGGVNSGYTRSRRESRSPNFNSEATIDRPRPGFGEHMINYAPPRNRASPPRPTRWIDGRKEQPQHFRRHEYRPHSGRSPPSRVFTRGRRYDLMDSSGRAKPAEFYRPVNSGKFSEIVGFDRGSRNNGRGDNRRGHGDSYQMLHSMRLFDNDGNMKRHQYDGKDGFRCHDPQPRSSEFQGESPREFGRNIERQTGDSSWRFKEENGQFREDGDAQHNAFKSFGVREVDDPVDARRRPS